MRIDVSALCRKVLAEQPDEEGLEAALAGACRDLHGEDGDAVCMAVMAMIAHHAGRRGISRLDAARELAEGESILDATIRGGTGPPPPGVVADLLKSAESGNPRISSRVVRQVWSSDDGTPPPPELQELLREGVGKPVVRRRTVMTLPGGVRVPPWAGVLVILVIVLAYAALTIGRALRERDAPFAQVMANVEELEAAHRSAPEDVGTAVALARAYARKVAVVRSLARADRSGCSTGQDALERLGVRQPEAVLLSTAAAGEKLTDELLSLPSVPVEADLCLMKGHFLLAQARTEQAAQAAAWAAALDEGDVRPHVLSAMVFQAQGDYEAALREQEAAVGKLDAWLRRAPAARDSLLFDLGPSPLSGLRERQGEPDEWARTAREALGLHQMTLRALASQAPRPAAGP